MTQIKLDLITTSVKELQVAIHFIICCFYYSPLTCTCTHFLVSSFYSIFLINVLGHCIENFHDILSNGIFSNNILSNDKRLTFFANMLKEPNGRIHHKKFSLKQSSKRNQKKSLVSISVLFCSIALL